MALSDDLRRDAGEFGRMMRGELALDEIGSWDASHERAWRAADAIDAAARQGAPRQAGTETRGGNVWQTELGDHDTLRRLGLAVLVGTLVPPEAGAAVRLDFFDQSVWLEPEEAKRLSIALNVAALNAVHQDRAARRG